MVFIRDITKCYEFLKQPWLKHYLLVEEHSGRVLDLISRGREFETHQW